MVFSVQVLARKGEKQYKVRGVGGKRFIYRYCLVLARRL